MDSTAVACVRWVPRGRTVVKRRSDAKTKEQLLELAAEMREMNKEANATTDALDNDVSMAASSDTDCPEEPTDTPMSDDDHACTQENQDNDDVTFPGHQFFGTLETDLTHLLTKDPYLNKDGVKKDTDDEDEADAEEIRGTDYVLLAASADQELPTVEVYVYDQENGGFFVHHDIVVGNPPLALEWLDRVNTETGSYCAVGSYGNPLIEIWDLNVADQLEPVMVLGEPQGKKKKRDCGSTFAVAGHTAEVLTLHRNAQRLGVMASGSVDKLVKVWDLLASKCVATYTFHTHTVQTVQWHPVESPILLSAAYDRTVRVTDVRDAACALQGALKADAECCVWNRHAPTTFWISTEDGNISCFDMRKLEKTIDCTAVPLWSVKASAKPCSGVTDGLVPGLMVSCALDGVAKVWNVSGPQPDLVFERSLKAGPLFSVHGAADNSSLFSFGANVVVVWDLGDTDVINKAFNFAELGAVSRSNSVAN